MRSLIGTTKHNGLDPFAYLNYVFAKGPFINGAEQWDHFFRTGSMRYTHSG